MNIARLRLHHQQIATPQFGRADQVVAWLGALQAQDYPGALWSIGLRLPSATHEDIERAIVERSIVRTWSLRGTLQFVPAPDVHWMRTLVAPSLIARSATRQRELELDTKVLARGEKLFRQALQGDRQLTREAMLALLEKAGLSTAGQRGYHILWRLALEGVLCFGPHQGKQATFALLDEWCAPNAKQWGREKSIAELTQRYFTSHGPATLQDFVAWSGLKISEAKAGLNMCTPALTPEVIADQTYWFSGPRPAAIKSSRTAYLLPGFDELILGYRDRSPSLDPRYTQRICPGSNGMFIPTVVIDGQVVGTWKRTLKKKSVSVEATAFTAFSEAQRRAIAAAGKRYGQFVGRDAAT